MTRRIDGSVRVDSILIVDSACDQTLCGPVWTILSRTGRFIEMTGAFAGRNVGQRFPVVMCAAKIITPDGRSFCAVAHEALYDDSDDQVESLLAVHQCLSVEDNKIDDRPTTYVDLHGNPGTQQCAFLGTFVPLCYDGLKCYFKLEPISAEEMESLPRITITPPSVGPGGYEPKYRGYTRRSPAVPGTSVEEWQERLGMIPRHVVEKTLESTTQMVTSVEVETREIVRDHLMPRLLMLKYPRVNDVVYMDHFFSSVRSVRGHTMFLLFAFKKSHFDVIYLMKRKSENVGATQDLIRTYGAPKQFFSDNAQEFRGVKLKSVLRKHVIGHTFSEADHQNENLAERRGGGLKGAVQHLLHCSGAPLNYWCYALEYVCLVRQHLARRSLGWRTPHEMQLGETPDISVFRIPFWATVWYYVPKTGFPRSKMLPGRLVGIAMDVGDSFCYKVLTCPTDNSAPCVLARTCVRRRFPRDPEPPCVSQEHVDFLNRHNESLTIWDGELEDLYETLGLRPSAVPTAETDGSTKSDEVIVAGDANELVAGPPAKRPRLMAPTISSESAMDVFDEPLPAPLDPITVPAVVPGGDSASVPTEFPSAEEPSGRSIPVVSQPEPDDDDSVSHDDVPASQTEEIAAYVEALSQDFEKEQELFDSIVGHKWKEGVLFFDIKWTTDEISSHPFSEISRDFGYETAKYILEKRVGTASGQHSNGRFSRWARQYLKHVRRAVRRLRRFAWDNSDWTSDEPNSPAFETSNRYLTTGMSVKQISARRSAARRSASKYKKKKTKPGRNKRVRTFSMRYGVRLPKPGRYAVRDAYDLDKENGNSLWAEAIEKEVSSLLSLGCFSFRKPEDGKPNGYQHVPLHMVFDVKQDGRRKARLVANGSVVDDCGMSHSSTVVKGISVRLLDVIADKFGLRTLCGDVSNAFILAPSREKVFTYAGPEFGDRAGSCMTINKALYGLKSSSRAFRAHFADFLRSMGFKCSRYDRDVWLRNRALDGDGHDPGYDYICTHVDDFKIVAKDPDRYMEQIKAVFVIKGDGPPSYYLGIDYTKSPEHHGRCYLTGCKTYITECVRRLEDPQMFGMLLPKHAPMPPECHPELDDSPLLDSKGIRQFQMLIGMAQWATTIGRLDISFAVSSLSRFCASPRAGHLELALYLFGYLKKFPDRRIVVSSDPLIISDKLVSPSKKFVPDFLEDYPDAVEELDPNLPEA